MILILNVFLFPLIFLVGAQTSGFGSSSMPPTILTLQLIMDYAEEKHWKAVVFFDCIGSDGNLENRYR